MATESFFSSASLAYIASAGAGKDGKTYSIKPTDGSGDFTFSRGSNLAATRVGPTGLIEKGRENLLLQSNQFDTTPWGNNTAGDVILTSGQTGYDGSSDAWEAKNDGRAYFFQLVTYPSQVKTFSIYAKSGNQDYFSLYVVKDGGDPSVQCDLGLGTITSGDPDNIDATITPVSGATGWYRISLTWLAASTGGDTLRIYAGSSFGDTTIIQDAQLEIGLAASEVIETGATTGKAGLLEDEPRFDYSGGATCPSLLLEPSRTNAFSYSEYFGFGLSSQSSVTSITTNTTETLSPEGLYNATKLVFASGWNFSDSVASTLNVQSTTSVYVKAVDPNSNNTFRIFTGGSVSGNFTATNEWQRFDFTGTSTGGSICGIFRDSSSNAAELYIYGMQTEIASYPTSYIPNHSGGSVTRGAEGQTYSGFSSLMGQTEGTLFLDIDGHSPNGTELFSLNRSTTNAIFLDANNDVYRIILYADSVSSTTFTSVANTDRIKIAIAYQSNNFAIYANGLQVATNNTWTWTPNIIIDTLNFSVGGYVNSKNSSKFNQVVLFKERLSNADLETLTT